MNMQAVKIGTLCLAALLAAVPAHGQEPRDIHGEVQDAKQLALELNRDLFILEEELLFPADTRLSVFLSVDVGEHFDLDAVKLSLDGELVTHYLYTLHQRQALRRGGVHRLYMRNIKAGSHELVAVFTGKGPKGRDYRRATSLVFEKTPGARNLELRIVDSEQTNQPEFQV